MRNDLSARKEEILKWISEHESNAEIARRLGCARDTVKNFYKREGIKYSGNEGLKGKKSDIKRKSAIELIAAYNNGEVSSISGHKLRNKLIQDRIKEAKCEICGLSEWMNKPIPLELHHKDLNHHNNELSNLQILCSNCHMQVHNYCNIKKFLK